MKCLLCESFSLLHICTHCQKTFLQPSLYERTLPNGIKVYSFYKYEDIKPLLFTKHTHLGFYIYTLLARNSFTPFAHQLQTAQHFVSLGIDDNVKSGYSHTAILNKALQTSHIRPLFHKLRATNTISYSGKTKLFRQQNPRRFKLYPFHGNNIILVDDIVTTGTTLYEATNILQKHHKSVSFCLTLSDAGLK